MFTVYFQRVSSGKLYLHPIHETHQLRPTLTYIDVLTRKSKRRGGNDSGDDSDDGPPPDPDEPAPPPAAKKEKKPVGEAREVQVAVRKSAEDRGGMPFGGGLTAMRREMLMSLRAEEDEKWDDYEYCDGEVRVVGCLYLMSRYKYFIHRHTSRTKLSKPYSPATTQN